ncbi:MAG TPA: M12 family metallo-peptidase [Pyrinomonadaceae bacterium]|nr:M12 family metallo-peptidase [Pyrinomonadaceae bacterium]
MNKKYFIGIGLVVIFVIGISIWTKNVASRQVVSFNEGELWRDVAEDSFYAGDERQIVPDSYRTLKLNKDLLQNLLAQAPMEESVNPQDSELVISLPLPNGKFSRFKFVESPIMEEGLRVKFPEIKTYLGQGIDEPSAITRFDFTPKGFHAMILDENGSIFVDPYSKNDTENYISYNKYDLQRDENFACLVSNSKPNALEKARLDKKLNPSENLVNNGGTLHTYRLAMAATGEYTTFHGGTVPLALAAITTTMNRVNAVYQRDLSVRMNLIANNNLIIYTNAATDPYLNDSSDLPANQTNITNVIGAANYDVGHLVGTGGGGVATLNSPCNAATKARGLTGSSSPVGDPFDIDYVAHEMGHQFGGNHTFNNNDQGSCAGNRASTAAYEPGSGATIQAYAGICNGQDIQRNSDDYFHIRSLEEMTTFINTNTCDVESANANTAPVVTAAPACTIPINTPFELTGSATDANNDALTYTWEEYDLGAAATAIPNSDNTGVRPIFRSYKPTTAGRTRTFPSLPFITANANVPPSTFTGTNAVGTVCAFGSCMTGELLPTVSRTMNFQLVARDNRAGGGGIRSAQTTVTVDAGSGPFAVSSQNTAVTYAGGTAQTVTWNVANTTAAPVSCANVNILYSTNGGITFPYVLASSTPNDGTQSVTIPNIATPAGRIKIQCATSCFFDINNVNITVNSPTAANAAISGRIATAQGFAINNATVVLTDANGNTRIAKTGSFGNYSFDGLQVGQTYTLTVSRKGYVFAQPSQLVTLNADLAEANFIAE